MVFKSCCAGERASDSDSVKRTGSSRGLASWNPNPCQLNATTMLVQYCVSEGDTAGPGRPRVHKRAKVDSVISFSMAV